MKVGIYYFSATGNSLAVARDLAREIPGAEVLPVTAALKPDYRQDYDCLGIVFPVYMFGLPLIVTEFLRKIQPKRDAYVFAVANYGGLPGRALNMARGMLRKRGIILSGGFGVTMPGNYTPLYGAISEKRQKAMFEQEAARVREIASLIREKSPAFSEEGPFLMNYLLYLLLYRAGSSRIPSSDTRFRVTEKCVKCGICQRVCPVRNIELREGKPAWLHHCQHCMACLQWCPTEAIQYTKATEGRKRYHHPLVSAEDIMVQGL